MNPAPMKAHRNASPEGARTHLEHRDVILHDPSRPSLPLAQKLLIAIGVASPALTWLSAPES